MDDGFSNNEMVDDLAQNSFFAAVRWELQASGGIRNAGVGVEMEAGVGP